jgi:hypothetical protein
MQTLWVDLVQDPDNLGARLSTTMGTNDCVGAPIIDVTNPAQSLLLTKLTDPPPCGALMPASATPLSDADRQCITDWVFAQASTP